MIDKSTTMWDGKNNYTLHCFLVGKSKVSKLTVRSHMCVQHNIGNIKVHDVPSAFVTHLLHSSHICLGYET